jgi:hypothetical protein
MGYAAPAGDGETSAEPAPGGDRAADSDGRSGGGHFHNVYLEPGAFERYETTGAFEEGTMLAMVVHEPARHAEPNRRGWFEGDRVGLEVAVKDTRRFEGGWAYFDFTGGGGDLRPAAWPFPPAACAACHAAHAANDNVFVQFYPVLRELDARREGTALRGGALRARESARAHVALRER